MSATAERLLAIAREIVIDEGADAVSMRRVAAAAGVTPMTIYRHYANREALLNSVAHACFAEIGHRWTHRPRSADLDKRVIELLDDHLDFALGQPRLYDFLFTERREGARRWPDNFRDGGSPSLNLVADVVRDGIRRGELRDEDEWELALMFAAMIHGLVRLYGAGRIDLSEEEFRALCHRFVGRMLDGFRA
ncbi:TetR/AcrR family transcriptional regulator [Dactylosporangium roseum]|uniref:TetR/AcrR family transcriptional regulator n=1 Tax=Dactylosporangium roseum TaxID=47989 RepID=UPI0021B3892C|nr:TetR/AcrR family transcriptional regulator [Dactylosporangium roseum]